MIVLGLVLLLIGLFVPFPGANVLFWIGLVLSILGAVFFVSGSVGRPVAGRRYWW